MTKEEISEYINRGDIPLSFIWEDGCTYNLYIFNEKYRTGSKSTYNVQSIYPNWYFMIFLIFEPQIRYSNLVSFKRSTMKETLTELLYWWELNKTRCKSVKYYIRTN